MAWNALAGFPLVFATASIQRMIIDAAQASVGIGVTNVAALALAIEAGAGADPAHVGGILHSDATPVSNVGASFEVLKSYTMLANTMETNQSAIRIFAWGTAANNADAKEVRLVFGGTTLLTNPLVTGSARRFSFDAIVHRTGAATQEAWCQSVENTGWTTVTSSPTETLSGAVVISVDGDGTNANDITIDVLVIEYLPFGN